MPQISASLENEMNARFGCAPEWCHRCDSPVWADDESELFLDSRELTSSAESGFPASELCPGTDLTHEV